MDDIIPKNIDDCEILVRFIFSNCIKKETENSIKLKDGEVFMLPSSFLQFQEKFPF